LAWARDTALADLAFIPVAQLLIAGVYVQVWPDSSFDLQSPSLDAGSSWQLNRAAHKGTNGMMMSSNGTDRSRL